MLFYDVTHTSHTRAQTGIQRVARSLLAALQASGENVEPIGHDPFLGGWRVLDGDELDALHPSGDDVAGHRGAHWPWSKRLAGRVRRLLGPPAPLPDGDGLICPELFGPTVAENLPTLFANVSGPRVALFHDAIALQFPEYAPAKTVARFPAYLIDLLRFDGIAAVSAASADSLRGYWAWLGVKDVPPIATIPLGADALPPSGSRRGPSTSEGQSVVVLCVGSLEGRKNHLALFEACEALWNDGLKFELRLIGLAQVVTGAVALDKLHALQAAGRPVRYEGVQPDSSLHAAYEDCTFTVYPSLLEGFGLPVLESLAHGKSCICSGRGALGESARGGGCLALDSVDAASLKSAMRRLLNTPEERARLEAEARSRTVRTWSDYEKDLTGWMRTLSRR